MKRNMFSGLDDLDAAQHLIAEFHDDLRERVARFHIVTDKSFELGLSHGVMLSGGSVTYRAWLDARASFIEGHFVGTVLLCQALLEHVIASELESRLDPVDLPDRVSAKRSREAAYEVGLITESELKQIDRLEKNRNPLTHYRRANDPEHADQKSLAQGADAIEREACAALFLTMDILAKPNFCLGSQRS